MTLAVGISCGLRGQSIAVMDGSGNPGRQYLYSLPHGTLPVAASSTCANFFGSTPSVAYSNSNVLHAVSTFGITPNFYTFSGCTATSQFTDGTVAGGSIVVDSSGNTYFASLSDILKYTPTGTRTTFYAHSPANVNFPLSLAFDGAGNLWSVGTGSVTSVGIIGVYTSAGVFCQWNTFSNPLGGIVIDNAGAVYTISGTNTFQAAVSILKFTTQSTAPSTFISYPSGASSIRITGLAYDHTASEMYLAWANNPITQIGVYVLDSSAMQSTFASTVFNTIQSMTIAGPQQTGIPTAGTCGSVVPSYQPGPYIL